jgi:thymidylate kinase
MISEIKQALNLLNGLNYVLFKCEHILVGVNKNVDILLSNEDYNKASEILKENGFILYMPETIEKYKRMFVKFDSGKLTAIHLHREVAWHGVIVLDKKPILERSEFRIPSMEDSLLIHSAHAIFENFKVSKFHNKLLHNYKDKISDYSYIDTQLKKKGWKRQFDDFNKDFKVRKKTILGAYWNIFIRKPSFLKAVGVKVIKAINRKFSLRRKGQLIALIGVNGSGKSTVKHEILKLYQPLTKFVSAQHGYYFGWDQSIFSKFLSKGLKQDNLFKKVSDEKISKFSLFHEGLFLYVYCSYLFRYLRFIYPKLRENNLVVCDRYFYDVYGQYPYSERSKILPFLPFPKPHFTFVLDADIDKLTSREKTGKEFRRVQPLEKLQGQRKRYFNLTNIKDIELINNNDNLASNINYIVDKTWGKFLM